MPWLWWKPVKNVIGGLSGLIIWYQGNLVLIAQGWEPLAWSDLLMIITIMVIIKMQIWDVSLNKGYGFIELHIAFDRRRQIFPIIPAKQAILINVLCFVKCLNVGIVGFCRLIITNVIRSCMLLKSVLYDWYLLTTHWSILYYDHFCHGSEPNININLWWQVKFVKQNMNIEQFWGTFVFVRMQG